MNNEIYEKNIQCLKLYYPTTYDDLIRCEADAENRPDDRIELDVFEGRRGFPTFKVIPREGKPFMGHSLFDPEREAAKKYSDETLFGEKTRLIVMGFGFGYEVRYLLEHSKNPIIIVIEPFVSVFRKALETVDVTDIIMTRRVVFSFAIVPEELKYTIITNSTHINLPDFRICVLPHVSVFKELGARVKEAVKLATVSLTFNMVTGMFAGPVFQNNLAMNFTVAMKNPGVQSLANCLKGKPVIVVAPGPSLEKNVEQLKRAKGKAFIIACDTATRPMLLRGVEPDAIISIDYQPANFFKLRGLDFSFAYFIPAMELTPSLPRNHAGRMFNYFHSQNSEEVFAPILGHRGILLTGGSVLTDAFNLARLMGADPIIFAGVDLGFPGMRWYAEGSFEDGQFTKDLHDGKHEMIEVKDIYGKPMSTYKSFYEFITWFGVQIPRAPQKVIDATEGGAKLTGTEIMTLSDAIDEYVEHQTENPVDVVDKIYESYVEPDHEEVIEKLDAFMADFVEIEKEVGKGLKSCKRAIDILKRSIALVDNKELIRLFKRINDAKRILKEKESESHLNFISPMMEKQMANIFYSEEDESLPRNERYRNLIELDQALYDKIHRACGSMKSHFAMIREDIRLEHDKEYV